MTRHHHSSVSAQFVLFIISLYILLYIPFPASHTPVWDQPISSDSDNPLTCSLFPQYMFHPILHSQLLSCLLMLAERSCPAFPESCLLQIISSCQHKTFPFCLHPFYYYLLLLLINLALYFHKVYVPRFCLGSRSAGPS